MKFKDTYDWNEETGKAIVKIEDNNGHTFIGVAQCHPDDKNYMSKNLGLELADIRARLNAVRHIRDNEIKPALKMLKHLQSTMEKSSHYNPKGYEARMLRRQIHMHQSDLFNIRNLINDYKIYMKDLTSSAENMRKFKEKEQMDKNE